MLRTLGNPASLTDAWLCIRCMRYEKSKLIKLGCARRQPTASLSQATTDRPRTKKYLNASGRPIRLAFPLSYFYHSITMSYYQQQPQQGYYPQQGYPPPPPQPVYVQQQPRDDGGGYCCGCCAMLAACLCLDCLF